MYLCFIIYLNLERSVKNIQIKIISLKHLFDNKTKD